MSVSLRNRLLVFLGLTFSLSFLLQYFIATGGGIDKQGIFILPLMWVPGTVGFLCCLLFREGFSKLNVRRASFKSLLISYLVPALAAVMVFVFLLVFKISEFQVSFRLLAKAGESNTQLIRFLLLAPTLFVLLGMINALGEELGWRGYLQSTLKEMKVKNSSLVIGAIWSLWHFPLILWGDYATSDMPIFSASLFFINVVSMSVIMGWIMTFSLSVWTATLAHSAHNVWIQLIYPSFILPGTRDPYFGGESGVFLALIYPTIALLVIKFPMRGQIP